ncbi:MAG TPA: hypothetical protein VG501_04365, partial [Rhizomicrobium sp.]|nr:hypothetical protein [Rhizomicrobium sp.]
MSSIGFSTLGGLDSLLLSYYQTQLAASPSALAANAAAASAVQENNSATAKDNPPWNNLPPPKIAQQAQLLSTTNFLDTSKVPLAPGATKDAKTEQDNQKLFALYNAVNLLSQLSQMAQSATATSGELAGLNTRFQAGLTQVKNYLASTDFNNFNLQSATPSPSVASSAGISFSNFTYATQQFVTNANINNPVAGVSASDSFTIGVKKGGVTTNVLIDLSQVQGPLTLGNIVGYINSQLSADGFSTRFQKTQKGGTVTSDANATYGLQITPGGNETISLSAAASPALYMVGNSGNASEVNTTSGTGDKAQVTTTPADEKGRLTKIGSLGTSPSAILSSNQDATSGVTTAAATAVDSSGNIYVLGNATGDIGNELNQGSQDVYLTKYDSAGNVAWQHLIGSAGSATGYGLALDPAGGVVISGASTADLTTTSVANGNKDSFVASYDAGGNQTWIKQIQTLAQNQANAVSVDASGNVYIGGSVSGGVIGAGQTASGGGDAYLAKFDSKGHLLAENQFGSSGADQVSATAAGSDGSLYVASVQNGEAVIAKYANGDITAAPVWSKDLGALSLGGNIGGLTVSGGQIYVSGSTSNANLTAGGEASVASASSGGMDAFVLNLTDNGATASANQVSYVGTGLGDQGGAVTVGPDGTVYLAGSTMGTFAGQQRNVANVSNAFAAALNADGSIAWTRQYGGASGRSTGAGLAVDPNGASVLDALGLPRGTINLNQSVDLTSQTTLRAGDSFQIKIDGVAPRTATITIDKGETLDSLARKINAQLGGIGKAATNYTGKQEGLKITVNAGQTIDLISGPADFDALARLGIAAGVLTAPASGSASTGSALADTSGTTPTFGLGLTGGITGGNMDISAKVGADLARSQLLSVLS